LTAAFAHQANETREVPPAASGYLAQPEMRRLIGTALGLGWELVGYEADFAKRPPEFAHLSLEETNWREDQPTPSSSPSRTISSNTLPRDRGASPPRRQRS
jgi:hypothetical protein